MRTKEDLAKYAREYRAKNKERIKEHNKKRNLKRSQQPGYKLKKRNEMLKRKYGITHKEYEEILKFQNGCCAICLAKPVKNYLHIDHLHKTGHIRGLLCHQCNWYMGIMDREREMYIRLLAYGSRKLPWMVNVHTLQEKNNKLKTHTKINDIQEDNDNAAGS